MKLLGTLSNFVSAAFQATTDYLLTLKPNGASSLSADRDLILPDVDADDTLISRTSTDTLTNKEIEAATVKTSLGFTNQAVAKFYEQSGNGTNFIGLSAPDSVAADKTFKLPGADGSANQVIKTDGSLNLSFGSVGTQELTAYVGGTPASSRIGASFGTVRSGTGGDSASTRSTTAVLNSAYAAPISITLDKGVYLVGYRLECSAYGSTVANLTHYLAIGTSAVTSAFTNTAPSSTRAVGSLGCIPVVITADATVVSVYARENLGSADTINNNHELWAVRIA